MAVLCPLSRSFGSPVLDLLVVKGGIGVWLTDKDADRRTGETTHPWFLPHLSTHMATQPSDNPPGCHTRVGPRHTQSKPPYT